MVLLFQLHQQLLYIISLVTINLFLVNHSIFLELDDLYVAVWVATAADEPVLGDRDVEVVLRRTNHPEVPRLVVKLPFAILEGEHLPENNCFVM